MKHITNIIRSSIMKKLLIILFFPFQLLYGQTDVALDSCYIWARKNYPNLKNSELWKEISNLKKENYKTSYFPKVTLNGQITYQSDVVKIPVDVPGLTIPTVTRDRYNAYAELQQTIWDGGISEANKVLEDAILNSNLSQLEVEVYKLNEQVALVFFTSLVVDQQVTVLLAQIKMIEERLKVIESGIRNGVTEASAALVLKAEILNLEQQIIQIHAAKSASVDMLSILTGKNIKESSTFIYTIPDVNSHPDILRPELQLYASKISQFDTQKDLLGKTRNPKLFGFGQVGYGKPGLNMLLNEFKGYYLFGVGVSWNAFDWKNTLRKKQILHAQQNMVLTQQETFLLNLQLLLSNQKVHISKLEKMMEKDNLMVSLRSDITKAAASKLENETITASEYIREVQAETISKLSYELHKIQLNEAREKYNLIKGKKVSEKLTGLAR